MIEAMIEAIKDQTSKQRLLALGYFLAGIISLTIYPLYILLFFISLQSIRALAFALEKPYFIPTELNFFQAFWRSFQLTFSETSGGIIGGFLNVLGETLVSGGFFATIFLIFSLVLLIWKFATRLSYLFYILLIFLALFYLGSQIGLIPDGIYPNLSAKLWGPYFTFLLILLAIFHWPTRLLHWVPGESIRAERQKILKAILVAFVASAVVTVIILVPTAIKAWTETKETIKPHTLKFITFPVYAPGYVPSRFIVTSKFSPLVHGGNYILSYSAKEAEEGAGGLLQIEQFDHRSFSEVITSLDLGNNDYSERTLVRGQEGIYIERHFGTDGETYIQLLLWDEGQSRIEIMFNPMRTEPLAKEEFLKIAESMNPVISK